MDTVEPGSVGCCPVRLARIDAAMQGYIDRGQIAGILAMVARQGKLAYARCFGQMDVEAGKPVQLDTLWRIYSMTKPITSVAVMMLYEEGHFHLTDPVSRYLPVFGESRVWAGGDEDGFDTVAAEREITIHDLLTHTSGLATGLLSDEPIERVYARLRERTCGASEIFTTRSAVADDGFDSVATLPLAHQPGTRWR